MINTLFGIKKNMTSTYDARGRRVGATVVAVLANLVTQIKTADSKDKYDAVQLGVGTKKSVKKPQLGQAKKVGSDQKIRWFREVRIKDQESSLKADGLGKEIKVNEIFSTGDEVKVTGISKGKGFQGGVRRHGFAGGPKTHGQSDRHRAPGSIGQTTTPGRVYKGKKMAGHMGSDTVTVRGLEVIKVDKKSNEMIIKGAVPGASGSLVRIEKLGRIRGYIAPPEEKEDEPSDAKAMEGKEENNEKKTMDSVGAVKTATSEEVKGEENAGK